MNAAGIPSTNKLSKNKFQVQMSFTTAFRVLTSGVFLSGLATMMGAGDVMVGYISIIMNICGALIIFFAPFMERFKSRKKVTIVLTALSKSATVLIVLVPYIVPKGSELYFFVALIVIAFSLQAQTQVSLNNWLIHFVEEEKRGRYISIRMMVELVITILLSIAAGNLIDRVGGRHIAFVMIFGIAFIMAILEIITLLKIDDVRVSQDARTRYALKDLFLVPWRNKEYRDFVVYITLFYFLLYTADSFTSVYLLKYLELNYTEITLTQQMFQSMPQLFLLFAWGRLSDKKGHKFVLNKCLWFFAFEVLFVMLSAKETALYFLPIAFTFGALGNSGFNISLFNRRYELIPDEGRIVYDNFFSAAVGVALLLGPITGEALKNGIARSGIASGVQFGELRALYAISFIGLIVLQLFSTRKVGNTKKQLLLEGE